MTNYFKVNTTFGGEEALLKLVKTAHKKGIKVLADFVPNHTSDMHPYALKQMVQARHIYDYYARNEDGEILSNPWWNGLLFLNYQNPQVVSFMEKALVHWAKAYEVDGFRIDAAWELKNRAPEVFPRIIEKVERESEKELIWIAEGAASAPLFFCARL